MAIFKSFMTSKLWTPKFPPVYFFFFSEILDLNYELYFFMKEHQKTLSFKYLNCRSFKHQNKSQDKFVDIQIQQSIRYELKRTHFSCIPNIMFRNVLKKILESSVKKLRNDFFRNSISLVFQQ